MGLFKSAMEVAVINLRRWLNDIRVRVVFLFMGYIIFQGVWSFTSYALETGHTCTACLLPVLFREGSFGSTRMVLHIGMLLLLCDAPFFSPISPYMILRSRRNAWWLGECIYIVIAALIYTIFITVLSALLVLPVITWKNDWGTLLYKIAFAEQNLGDTEALIQYWSQFEIRPEKDVIRYLVPFGSQLYTFAAAWCSFSLLGLLMYLISLVRRNVLTGIAVASIFIFIDPLITWMSGGLSSSVDILSPVGWTSISKMKSLNRFNTMSIPLALGLYAALIILMGMMIARCSKKTAIDLIR